MQQSRSCQQTSKRSLHIRVFTVRIIGFARTSRARFEWTGGVHFEALSEKAGDLLENVTDSLDEAHDLRENVPRHAGKRLQ